MTQQTPANLVTISIRPAINYRKKGKESLFIGFPSYNIDFVSNVKSLKDRQYHSSTREWEVPVTGINEAIQALSMFPIKLVGKVHTDGVVAAAQPAEITFDKVDGSTFKFKTKPFQHQVDAFQYAMDHPKYILGDEQGLGKTKQSIDQAVARKGQFKHCLIVCCINSSKHNWLKEVEMHSDETGYILGSYINTKGRLCDGTLQDRLDDLNSDLDDYFLITNIETLRYVKPKKDKKTKELKPLSKTEETQNKIVARVVEMIQKGQIGMVIVDEIHKIKNHESQSAMAILQMQSYYRAGLSGTPLMNSPLDLFVPMAWLGEEKIRPYWGVDERCDDFFRYRNRYCEMGGYGGKEIVGYKNMSELHGRFGKVMLRRKKEEVLDLPPKIRSTEYVELTPKQQKLYKEVKAYIQDNLNDIVLSPNPLANLIRLRQVTGHPGIISDLQDSAKMDRLEEMIEEIVANGRKAIVFSNWEDMTKVARERLKRFNPAYITGGANTDVEEEKEKFQNDPKCSVIIGTIGKLGTAHTLTAASYVFFLDKPWNRAVLEQAEDRAHRIGTAGTVNVISLVAKGTIDERIEEIIAEKGDIADALVDGKLDKLRKLALLERLLED